MEPTIFRYKRPKTRWNDIVAIPLYLLMALIHFGIHHSNYFETKVGSWYFLAATICFLGVAILGLLKIAGIDLFARRSAQIHLSLDEEGLTYARGGLSLPSRWSWNELSDIKYERPGLLRRKAILFRPESPGLIDRMTMEITDFGRRELLPDTFDAEPEEIVAKLNEYRDRALGGANTPAN